MHAETNLSMEYDGALKQFDSSHVPVTISTKKHSAEIQMYQTINGFRVYHISQVKYIDLCAYFGDFSAPFLDSDGTNLWY